MVVTDYKLADTTKVTNALENYCIKDYIMVLMLGGYLTSPVGLRIMVVTHPNKLRPLSLAILCNTSDCLVNLITLLFLVEVCHSFYYSMDELADSFWPY